MGDHPWCIMLYKWLFNNRVLICWSIITTKPYLDLIKYLRSPSWWKRKCCVYPRSKKGWCFYGAKWHNLSKREWRCDIKGKWSHPPISSWHNSYGHSLPSKYLMCIKNGKYKSFIWCECVFLSVYLCVSSLFKEHKGK